VARQIRRNCAFPALACSVAMLAAVGFASITGVAVAASPHEAKVERLVSAWGEARDVVPAGNPPSLKSDLARPDKSTQQLAGFAVIGMAALALLTCIAVLLMRPRRPRAGATERTGKGHPLVAAVGRLYTRY
jgi:hypothetical protein